MEAELGVWLSSTIEDPIYPAQPICDPHHHLWDYSRNHIPFYATHVQRYSLNEFLQDTGGGHNIVQTVFVECGTMYRKDGHTKMWPVGETEFVSGIAAQSASGKYGITKVAAGIVGYADLTLGTAVEPVLEAHIAVSMNRFRGIRFREARHTSPRELMLNTKFREGLACLQKYNLSLDILVFHPHLVELVEMASAFPNIRIIVNHTGGPRGDGPYTGKRDEVFREWKRAIAAVASCPNLVIKLGGLGMPICGFGWHERSNPPNSIELAKVLGPYFQFCIEQFGVNRCLFEGNFPVDKRSYSYTIIWNAFKRISQDFSSEERCALFHDNAVKVYRLEKNMDG